MPSPHGDGDLISFSPTPTRPVTPTSTTHPATSVIPRFPTQDKWTVLEPDPPGAKLSTRYDSPCPSIEIEVSPETTRGSGKDLNLISIATHTTDKVPSTPTRAKGIPLPSSPGIDSDDNDGDRGTDTLDDGSQSFRSSPSALSAEARPFEAQSSSSASTPKALRVSRSRTPLSFFGTCTGTGTNPSRTHKSVAGPSTLTFTSKTDHPASDQWSDDGSRVSAEEMDPKCFESGFGGAAVNPAWAQQQSARPCLFDDRAQVQDRPTTTSSKGHKDGDDDVDDNKDKQDGDNPEMFTPMSMRVMQSAATRTSSTSSSTSTSPRTRGVTLPTDDDSGSSGDYRSQYEPGISESFESISLRSEHSHVSTNLHLRPGSRRDRQHQHHDGGEDEQEGPTGPIEKKLISIAVPRSFASDTPVRAHSSDQYSQGQSGVLTPENTDDSLQHRPPSTTPTLNPKNNHQEQQRQEEVVNADGTDHRLASVSHTSVLEHVLNVDETNNIGRAFSSLIDAVGRCQSEVEQGLARLQQGAFRQQHALQEATPTIPSTPSVEQLDNQLASARQVALASQLRGIRIKLGQATEEIAKLKARLAKSEDQLRVASVQIRVEEAKKEKSVFKLSQSKRRAQELVGKLIRLEEEHEVLVNMQEEHEDDEFVVVLLEADGRMFDPRLLSDPAKGGQQLVTNIVDKLAELYSVVKGRDVGRSQIIIHVFIDIEANVQELRTARWIKDQGELIRHLDGFRDGHPLVSVTDIPGLENDGSCITSWMNFYQRLTQCRMIVLGTGWNKPYRNLIAEWETDERIDKVYSIRSTAKFDVDPFKGLGPEKLLYIDRLWSVGVSEWKTLLRGIPQRVLTTTLMDLISSRQHSESGSESTASRISSATDQTAGSITPRGTSNGRSQRDRRTSPTSVRVPTPPTTSSKPPWQVQMAPRPQSRAPNPPNQGGGSLLDQLNSMRSGSSSISTTSTSTRSSSPGSDRTIGPPHLTSRVPAHRVLNIELDDFKDGSIGGSPPSSDSDEPSVPVPHGSRQYVRRPTAFADPDPNDDPGTMSDESTFTVSTLSASGAGGGLVGRRNPPKPPPPIKVKQTPSTSGSGSVLSFTTSRLKKKTKPVLKPYTRNVPAAPSVPSMGVISMVNRVPGGSRPTWDQRMGTRIPDMIDMESRRAGSGNAGGDGGQAGGTIHGFKLHNPMAGAHSTRASRRGTEEYKRLRSLNPSPCHRFHLDGHCLQVNCKYGHQYNFDEQHLGILRCLAKELKCFGCNRTEEDCIYSHRCPRGPGCKYRADCWFIDKEGKHIL